MRRDRYGAPTLHPSCFRVVMSVTLHRIAEPSSRSSRHGFTVSAQAGRHEPAVERVESPLKHERHDGRRYRSREQHRMVVHREPRDDAFAISAGADESSDRGGPDVVTAEVLIPARIERAARAGSTRRNLAIGAIPARVMPP